VQSQVAALESMTEDGAAGILIAPADSTELVAAIERAREAG
jgi:ABC-type sugar transport system substrate-binding protein